MLVRPVPISRSGHPTNEEFRHRAAMHPAVDRSKRSRTAVAEDERVLDQMPSSEAEDIVAALHALYLAADEPTTGTGPTSVSRPVRCG